jgi:hypothetical protein
MRVSLRRSITTPWTRTDRPVAGMPRIDPDECDPSILFCYCSLMEKTMSGETRTHGANDVF